MPGSIRRCPLLGVKRTLIGSAAMSAFGPKAEIGKRAARSARSLLSDLQHATAQSGNRPAVSCLPAPGTGAIPGSRFALLVDLRDHIAIAGKQRLSRAHLGT